MIDFTIHQLFPDFILADKNGYAMAKAIERALQIMCSTIQTGVDNLQNIDKMPEWLLDEMAWELGCLYDYGASLETKRKWIRDATKFYAALGTPEAIYQYLCGVFDSVAVEEAWQYGGEPFHFRVIVSGEWTEEKVSWARKAIEASKNVRSVLDELAVGANGRITVSGKGVEVGRIVFPLCGDWLCGAWPETAE
jgi:P2-related tail formation protein